MKKFLLLLILLPIIFLTGCGYNQKIQNEWNSNLDKWNTNLDIIITKIDKDVDDIVVFDYDYYSELSEMYDKTYTESTNIIRNDKNGVINRKGTDIDKKISYLSDFFTSLQSILQYEDSLINLIKCYKNFDEQIEQGSSNLSNLSDSWQKCVKDDLLRSLGYSDVGDDLLDKEDEYNETQYLKVFQYLYVEYLTIRDINSEYQQGEFQEIFDKFESKYGSTPEWQEMKISGEVGNLLEKANNRLEYLDTELEKLGE